MQVDLFIALLVSIGSISCACARVQNVDVAESLRYWRLSHSTLKHGKDRIAGRTFFPPFAHAACPPREQLGSADTPAAISAELGAVFGSEQSTALLFDAVAGFVVYNSQPKSSSQKYLGDGDCAAWQNLSSPVRLQSFLPSYGRAPLSSSLINPRLAQQFCKCAQAGAVPPIMIAQDEMGMNVVYDTNAKQFDAANLEVGHLQAVIDAPHECDALANRVSPSQSLDGPMAGSVLEQSDSLKLNASNMLHRLGIRVPPSPVDGPGASVLGAKLPTQHNVAPAGQFAWQWLPRDALDVQCPGLAAITNTIICPEPETRNNSTSCRMQDPTTWWHTWGLAAAAACAVGAHSVIDPAICVRVQIMTAPDLGLFAAAIRLLPLESAGGAWLSQARQAWRAMRQNLRQSGLPLKGQATLSRYHRHANEALRPVYRRGVPDWAVDVGVAARVVTSICFGRVIYPDASSLQTQSTVIRVQDKARTGFQATERIGLAKPSPLIGVGMRHPENAWTSQRQPLPSSQDPARIALARQRPSRGVGLPTAAGIQRGKSIPGSLTTHSYNPVQRFQDGVEVLRGPGAAITSMLLDAWGPHRLDALSAAATEALNSTSQELEIGVTWNECTSLTDDYGIQWRPVIAQRVISTAIRDLAGTTRKLWGSQHSKWCLESASRTLAAIELNDRTIKSAGIGSIKDSSASDSATGTPSVLSAATLLCPTLLRGVAMPYAAQIGMEQDQFVAEIVWPGLEEGYFVEAGAVDGRRHSTTWSLEQAMGWRGLLVEARQVEIAPMKLRRPRSYCVHAALGAADKGHLELRSWKQDITGVMARPAGDTSAEWEARDPSGFRSETAPFRALGSLLEEAGAPSLLHFVTLDTEGGELATLRTFPFERYEIGALTVEHAYSYRYRGQLAALLASNGMVYVGQTGWDDLWLSKSVASRVLERLWEQQKRRRGRDRRTGFGGLV